MKAIAAVPRVSLEVNGRAVTPQVLLKLSDVTVQQQLSAPAFCELTFSEDDAESGFGRWLVPGASIRLGTGEPQATLFDGEVTAVEWTRRSSGGGALRVRAYDRLQRLRGRQPVRVHVQMTVLDLARELTADTGLSVRGPERLPVWPRLIQYRHSDLDLLVLLAARCGLYLFAHDGTLAVQPLTGDGPTRRLVLGDNLLDARAGIDSAAALGSVSAFGWDPARFLTYDAASQQASDGLRGSAADIGERTLTHQTAADAAHLTAAAQAAFDWRAAGVASFAGVCEGDPCLRPGASIEVHGVAPGGDRSYVVTHARHTIDRRSGYVTELGTEPPAFPAETAGVLAVPGIVRSIDDPDRLGRVRIALPTIAGLETDWLSVLAAGAGAGKGVMVLPDAGDQVLALVSADNPATGTVIGGTYGSAGIPDAGIEDGAVARYTLQTPAGQRIELDDAGRRVRVTNAGGSFVDLGPDRVTVHAAADLVIEAPGRAVVIQGQTVDFVRA
jgi:phage protein D